MIYQLVPNYCHKFERQGTVWENGIMWLFVSALNKILCEGLNDPYKLEKSNELKIHIPNPQ